MTSHNYNSNSGISSTTIPEIWNNEWILLEGKYTRWLPLCQIQLADVFFFVCVHVNSPQSYLTLCNPMDCRFLGSSIHGILQARILEWVAISFSVCVCILVFETEHSLVFYSLINQPLFKIFIYLAASHLSCSMQDLCCITQDYRPLLSYSCLVHMFTLVHWSMGLQLCQFW